MAGIKFPPGVTYLQPVVHVDSPKIVSKYEAMAEKSAQEAQERIASIQYELNEALRAKLLLEKQLTEKEAGLLALANLKNMEVVAMAMPESEETKQLRSSAARLKEELAAAYKTMRVLQEKASEAQVVTKVERVVEYRDRDKIVEVEEKDHKALIWVALLAISAGIVSGYFIPRNKPVIPAVIEVKKK
jgi:hypothetical protein